MARLQIFVSTKEKKAFSFQIFQVIDTVKSFSFVV